MDGYPPAFIALMRFMVDLLEIGIDMIPEGHFDTVAFVIVFAVILATAQPPVKRKPKRRERWR